MSQANVLAGREVLKGRPIIAKALSPGNKRQATLHNYMGFANADRQFFGAAGRRVRLDN